MYPEVHVIETALRYEINADPVLLRSLRTIDNATESIISRPHDQLSFVIVLEYLRSRQFFEEEVQPLLGSARFEGLIPRDVAVSKSKMFSLFQESLSARIDKKSNLLIVRIKVSDVDAGIEFLEGIIDRFEVFETVEVAELTKTKKHC